MKQKNFLNSEQNVLFEQMFYENKIKINKIYSFALILMAVVVVVLYILGLFGIEVLGPTWTKNIILCSAIITLTTTILVNVFKTNANVETYILCGVFICCCGLLFFLFFSSITLLVIPVLIVTLYFDKKLVVFNSVGVLIVTTCAILLNIFLEQTSEIIRDLHTYEGITIYQYPMSAITGTLIPELMLIAVITLTAYLGALNGRNLIVKHSQSVSNMSVIQKELSMAAEIQKNILPSNFFTTKQKNLNLYAFTHPAKETAGDFYDYFYVNDTTLAFMVADVSDKGLSAAMFMMLVKSTISNSINYHKDLKKSLEMANNLLYENNKEKMFTTLWIGYINLTNGEVQYVNAGHLYPVLLHNNGTKEIIKNEPNVFLGAFKDVKFDVNNFAMKKGDKLFLYTDGVTDATNCDGRNFGEEKLYNVLGQKNNSPQNVCDGVLKEIKNYIKTENQFDDITAMCFSYENIIKKENELVLFAKDYNIEKIIDEINKYIKNKCDETTRNNIDVAIDEICSNICNYAQANLNIIIKYKIVDDTLVLTFVDDGQMFNPLEHKKETKQRLKIGGNGIMLVKALMDKVEYFRFNEKNVLTIKKNLKGNKK